MNEVCSSFTIPRIEGLYPPGYHRNTLVKVLLATSNFVMYQSCMKFVPHKTQ